MELIKITSDIEKVKSILDTAELIESRIKIQDRNTFISLITSDYYEIIKELLTALLLIDGYKTLSHKDLVDYLEMYYKDFEKKEIRTIDSLRIYRNRVAYEGFKISQDYLANNELDFKQIIKRLKSLINKRLKEEK
ncbi:MAG: hypothetical protein KKA64_01960 [Nanoarchaeota archaeon]|nr:hypothetical protein [Nanoarchaeota archaeon]